MRSNNGKVLFKQAGFATLFICLQFLLGNLATAANPGDISTAPTFWFDASDTDTLTVSNGKVSQWDNKAGSGALVQGTSTYQPTLNSSDPNFNNNASLLFTDTDQSFLTSTATLNPSNAKTLFLVGSLSNKASNGYAFNLGANIVPNNPDFETHDNVEIVDSEIQVYGPFSLEVGQTITATMVNSMGTSGDADFDLFYNEVSGTPVGRSMRTETDEIIQCTLGSAGTNCDGSTEMQSGDYYLRVFVYNSSGTVNYDLSVTIQHIDEVAVDDTYTGEVITATERVRDYGPFYLNENGTITVTTSQTSGEANDDVDIYLYYGLDRDTKLATSEGYYADETFSCTIGVAGGTNCTDGASMVPGNYYVRVFNWVQDDGDAHYDVNIQVDPAPVTPLVALHQNPSNQIVYYNGNGDTVSGTSISVSNDEQPHIFTLQANAGTTNVTWKLIRDGVTIASSVTPAQNNDDYFFNIGALLKNDEFFNGSISEIIYFESALSDTDIDDVSAYLESKHLELTQTWTGNTDGKISDASNWQNNTAPDASSDLIYNSLSGNDSNWNLAATTTVNSLLVDEGYTGTLTIKNDITITNGITLNTLNSSFLVNQEVTTSHTTYNDDGHVTINLNALVDGNYGRITETSGTSAPAGTLHIIESIDETSLSLPYSFNIFNWAGFPSSTFKDISFPRLTDGYAWDLSELYTSGVVKIIEAPGAAAASMTLWLTADDAGSVVTSTGNQVVRWINKAGKTSTSNDPESFRQTIADKQPLLQSNALNGLPALEFDGVNDWFDLPYYDYDKFVKANEHTIIAVYKSVSTNTQILFGWQYQNNNNNRVQIETNSTFTRFDSVSDAFKIREDRDMSSEFTLITGLRTPSTQAFYTDTILSGELPNTYSLTSEIDRWRLGTFVSSDVLTFNGQLAELIVFEDALSETQLDNINQYLINKYNLSIIDTDLEVNYKLDETSGTTALDANNYMNGTLENMAGTEWTQGIDGNALEFNGTNQRIDISGALPFEPESYAYSTWIKADSVNSEGGELFNINGDIGMRVLASGDVYAYMSTAGTGTWESALYDNYKVLDGYWHHILVSFDGSANELTLTVDGHSGTGVSTSALVYDEDDLTAYIGDHSDGLDSSYIGLIDDTRLYSRSINSTDIQQIIADAQVSFWNPETLVGETDESGSWTTNKVPDTNDLLIFQNTNAQVNFDGSLIFGGIEVRPTFTGRLNLSNILSLTNDFTQSENAHLTLALNSLINPANARITAQDINLAGTLAITYSASVAEATFNLFNASGSINGTFDEILLPSLGNGFAWDLSNLYTTGDISIIKVPGHISQAPMLWLNAQDEPTLIQNESDEITTWVNKAGTDVASNAASTATYRPTVETNKINGLSSVILTNDFVTSSSTVNPQTMIFVFKEVSSGKADTSLVVGDYAGWYPSYAFKANRAVDGLGEFFTRAMDGSWSDADGPQLYQTGYHIITAVWEPQVSISYYVDGQLINTGTDSNPELAPVQFHIGGSFWNSDTVTGSDGEIAEVILFQSALSEGDRELVESDLAAKYNISLGDSITAGLVAHYPLDETGGTVAADLTGSHNGTLTNMAGNEWSAGIIDNSLAFDGTNQYVDIPSLATLDASNLSISAWFKADPSQDTSHDIVNIEEDFVLRVFDDGRVMASVSQDGGGWYSLFSSRTDLEDNRWHHAVLSYDDNAGILRLYIDGILETSLSGLTKGFYNGNNVRIGHQASGNTYRLKGSVDDVRIYNKALNANEVALLIEESNVKFWDNEATLKETNQAENWIYDQAPDEDDVLIIGSSSENITWNSGLTASGIELREGFNGSLKLEVQVTLDGAFIKDNNNTINFAIGGQYGPLNNGAIIADHIELGGTLQVSYQSGFTPELGQTFQILDWNTLEGQFNHIILPALPTGLSWDLSTLYTDGTLRFIETPGAISQSPLLWLDANDAGTVLKDESNLVSKWFDKSGRNYHALQADADRQPVFIEDAINTTHDVVQMDGSRDFMDGSLEAVTDFTLIIHSKNFH